MYRVLLIEDTKSTQRLVQELLKEIAHVHCAESLRLAETEVLKAHWDLLILDVGLPDGDGFDFCLNLRKKPEFADLPIVFLTNRITIDEKVLGFELGADDYVTKPLEPREFTARILSKLRRSKRKSLVFEAASFRIDLTTQRISTVGPNDVQEFLNLTPIEFKLLSTLLRNHGKVLSRDSLIAHVWQPGLHVSAHTLDTHLSTLRKKLGNNASKLKVIPRQGYSFG